MALTYAQRYKLITDTVLQQRCSVAIWERSLEILNDAGSTTEQKQEARQRLKRPANELEARVCLIRVVADPAVGDDGEVSDAELQDAVNRAYAQLPAP